MKREDKTQMRTVRLGVNVDHVATVRNARGGAYPEPVRAAQIAIAAGADGITAHLREDRRHIRDGDIQALKDHISKPLNFEMAATEEMMAIALRIKPHAVCLVPEMRTEVTTEGGLDVIGQHNYLRPYIAQLRDAGVRVSLFIDPDAQQLDIAHALGAHVVELHTGSYARHPKNKHELGRLRAAAMHAGILGLECHAGHGLTITNVASIVALPGIAGLNIGHFIVGEAVMVGMTSAVRAMKDEMERALIGASQV
jgi:pyridoxine 5-phosphate synthase